MYFHLPLLLFLLASVPQTDANLLARGSESLVHGLNYAHRHAIKRSSGLAQDLRRAFSGILVDQSSSASSGSYCELDLTSQGPSLSSPNNTASSSVPAPSATRSASSARPTSTAAASPWALNQTYQGNSFFDGWSFFTAGDPTDGNVQYVDQATAQSANLTSINSAGHAIMRVDTTPQVSGNRQSVRITTDYTYTKALVIMDSYHMPTGCGTWPAFWSNGPNWPAGGEIDIVEGVNTFTVNQATIHTNPGCTIPTGNSTALGISGNVVGGTNCAAAQTGNAGCGIQATQTNTFGPGFNAINGGVYAMQWTDDGISVWFFPRGAIPSDIAANAPLPTTWGAPMADWPATDCSPSTFFNDHSAIFDTTLCGQWAGNVWTDSGTAGQSQSCAQSTGAATCAEWVQGNGAAFNEAYWEVASVKIYQAK